jgi:hypothetical protein
MTEQARRATKIMVFSNTTIYGELLDVSPPQQSTEEIDSTSHNNVGNLTSSLPGWITPGEMTFKVNDYGGAEQAALYTQQAACTNSVWMVVYPMAFVRAYSFNGYVKTIKPTAPMKGAAATFDVTIKATGLISSITTAAAGLTTPFLSVTDQGSTSLTLVPAAATAVYEYAVTTDLADTGVKFTATAAAGSIYINQVLTATGVASAAITIGTTAGDIIMVPIVVMENSKVPKIYWVRVIHGAV